MRWVTMDTRARARARAKAKDETATTAVRQAFPKGVPVCKRQRRRKKGNAKEGCKESVTIAPKGHPAKDCLKLAKGKGKGKGCWSKGEGG